eukprot:2723628-Pleurochrysis_carterae.AAC.1
MVGEGIDAVSPPPSLPPSPTAGCSDKNPLTMLGNAQSHRGKKKVRAKAKRTKPPIMASSDEEAQRNQTALA